MNVNQEELVKRGRTTKSYLPIGTLLLARGELLLNASTIANNRELGKLIKDDVNGTIKSKYYIEGYGYNVYGINIGDRVVIRRDGFLPIELPENEYSYEKVREVINGNNLLNLKLNKDSTPSITDIDALSNKLKENSKADLIDGYGNKIPIKETEILGNQLITIVIYGLVEAYNILAITNRPANA